MFEDIKGLVTSRKSKDNGQEEKDKKTNNS
jgi:hypothetical protein